MGRYLVAAAPGVIAQPLHGVAVDGGRQAALVVFQAVVHRASLVVLGDLDFRGIKHPRPSRSPVTKACSKRLGLFLVSPTARPSDLLGEGRGVGVFIILNSG